MDQRELYEDCFSDDYALDGEIDLFDEEIKLKVSTLFCSNSFDVAWSEIEKCSRGFSRFKIYADEIYVKEKKVKIKDYDKIIKKYESLVESINKSLDPNLRNILFELLMMRNMITDLKYQTPCLTKFKYPSQREIYFPFFEDLVDIFLEHRVFTDNDKPNNYVLDCSEYIDLISNSLSSRYFSFSTLKNEHSFRPPTTEYWGALPTEVKELMKFWIKNPDLLRKFPKGFFGS